MTTVTTKVLRVLVVDEAAARRAEITRTLVADGDVTVVGECNYEATLDCVRAHKPDVVVLADRQDHPAAATLETIMAYAPTPTLVLRAGRDLTAAAERRDIEAGAAGVLAWPAPGGDNGQLRQRVRVLRNVTVVRHPRGRLRSDGPRRAANSRQPTGQIVGMAASTGGPHSLVEVVRSLADITVPVLIVQHIHPEFVEGFAQWMSRATRAKVVMAENDAVPEGGVFHIAPSGYHLRVTPGRHLRLDAEPVTLHRPSATELFNSMATALGKAAVGVLLTGMGDDGAAGLLAIRRAGGVTIVQDGATSAIDGMPRAARELGAAEVVAPLDKIAGAVLRAVEPRR